MKVVLTFQVTGSEEEAWAIAEALEIAARAKGYQAANSWVEADTASREGVLVGEESTPPKTSAALVTRQEEGAETLSIGGITLGDDDGRSVS